MPPGYLSKASDRMPLRDSWHVIALGPLRCAGNALREVRRSIGVNCAGFSDMSVQRLAAVVSA